MVINDSYLYIYRRVDTNTLEGEIPTSIGNMRNLTLL